MCDGCWKFFSNNKGIKSSTKRWTTNFLVIVKGRWKNEFNHLEWALSRHYSEKALVIIKLKVLSVYTNSYKAGWGNCQARWGIGWFKVLNIIKSGWNFIQLCNSSLFWVILSHFRPKNYHFWPFRVGKTFFSSTRLDKIFL